MAPEDLDFSKEDDLDLALAIAGRVFDFLVAEASRRGKTPREVLVDHISKRKIADGKMEKFLDSLPK